MNRIVSVLVLLLMLCGCSAAPRQDVFTVEDGAALSAAAPVYRITFAVPTNAVQTASTREDGCCVYEAEDGSYTILTAVYAGAEPETVMQAETGFTAAALHPTAVDRFGMQGWRYGWTAQGETGALVCAGALYCDGACCYCLQFRAPEQTAKACRNLCAQVLDSFSLFEDEGF